MTPTMPITTDNIYKFAVFFGLALIITVIVGVIYLPDRHTQLSFQNRLELENLKIKEDPSPEDEIAIKMLEAREQEMAGYLRFIFKGGLVSLSIGIFLVLWGGFIWWWRIQPKQDELMNLQIEKTKLEIQTFNEQLNKKNASAPYLPGHD